MNPRNRILSACVLAGVFLTSIDSIALCAQPCGEQRKLTASDANANDRLGYSISISGDAAIVGAFGDACPAGPDCGSAYVFRLDGADWEMEERLTASDADRFDLFGTAVSISGDAAIVGALGDHCIDGNSCGAAYVYRFDGSSWTEEQKLAATSADAEDLFGVSVAISDDVAVVGASFDDCPIGLNCGAAYVFRFDGAMWIEEQILTAVDADVDDEFGLSVSVDGDVAIVGSPRDFCSSGASCGSAHIFRFDGNAWIEEQKITAPDAAAFDQFGESVAVSGDTVIVGVQDDNCVVGGACGSAHIYRFDGSAWGHEQRISPMEDVDNFGISVSISSDWAVVGAWGGSCLAGPECGSAFVYRFDGLAWGQTQKLTAFDADTLDLFGVSVAISGESIAVGAYTDDCAAGGNCGSAYVFACPGIVSPPTIPTVGNSGLAAMAVLIIVIGALGPLRRCNPVAREQLLP